VQPYGVDDVNAPYINGRPDLGQQGSIPPAAAFEHPQREIVATIAKSGFFPVETDLTQLAQAVRSQALNYAEDNGVANNLTVVYDPPLTEYTDGLVLRVKARTTNTGPSSIDAGPGRVPIRMLNGGELGPGEIPFNGVITIIFASNQFQMSGVSGQAGAGGPTGPQGPPGATGPQGPQGPQGPTGPQGPGGGGGSGGIGDVTAPGVYGRIIGAWQQLTQFVLKAGDVMTGRLTIGSTTGGGIKLIINGSGTSFTATPDPATGSADIVCNKAVGATLSQYIGARNNFLRWSVVCGNSNAESSGNVGSGFAITGFNDLGTQLYNALQFDRPTGSGTFHSASQFKPGGGSWSATSDARIKTVLGDYAPGLEEVLRLRPIRYVYNGNDTETLNLSALNGLPEDPTLQATLSAPFRASAHFGVASEQKRFVGLVAQEVEPVFPDMVSHRQGFIDGERVDDIKALDTTELTYALVNAVKTLAAKVETLEAQLARR
jgi:hypothetical protein